ncbi:CorA family divalent cation transporter [Stenotrophomonas sp. HITSZ_GD]|uniref:CorA family divalent cation transporter n=1 Tax=Stenotrophomonas sp. HITSZ_GD TaxID=3037248 RepID=UPI00240D31EB|nr:CorA family divalent cation transporter [Stenotrophomonas sp. HITSZ_GD]MDG2525155.1 CorA family divalent cation transporter [Stenotrophomonas sp. HITSZ_GD]
MLRCVPYNAPDASPQWYVDLCQPTPEELADASMRLGFEIPDRAGIGEIEFTSRIRYEGDALVLNLPRFQYEAEHVVAPLGFVVAPQAMVMQREYEIQALDNLHDELQAHPASGAHDLFLRIIERIVDRLADLLESLENTMSETSREAFRRSKDRRATRHLERMLQEVGQMGRRIGALHNTLHGLLRMITFLDETAPEGFSSEEMHKRIKLIHKDLTSLGEFEQQLGDRIEFLLDSVLGLINMDQNEVMKVMAIASVVGIPPTVLVGVWGMNFANMPELHFHHGYAIALGAIALSIIVPLVWFRRRGWL